MCIILLEVGWQKQSELSSLETNLSNFQSIFRGLEEILRSFSQVVGADGVGHARPGSLPEEKV